MLENKIKWTIGDLMIGNFDLQIKLAELQAQLDVANAKVEKMELVATDGDKVTTP